MKTKKRVFIGYLSPGWNDDAHWSPSTGGVTFFDAGNLDVMTRRRFKDSERMVRVTVEVTDLPTKTRKTRRTVK